MSPNPNQQDRLPQTRTATAGDDTRQIGGDHYQKAVQPWDAMQAWFNPDEFRGFLRGNAVKYLARYQDKDGLQDLEKAAHYLEKLIEFEKDKA